MKVTTALRETFKEVGIIVDPTARVFSDNYEYGIGVKFTHLFLNQEEKLKVANEMGKKGFRMFFIRENMNIDRCYSGYYGGTRFYFAEQN